MPVYRRSLGTWHTTSGVIAAPPGAFVLGTTKPDATNTGADLTLIDGTLIGTTQIFSAAGATISNKRIEGYVRVTAANVTFSNCQIIGPTLYTGFPGFNGLVNCEAAGTVFDHCTIKMRDPAYYTAAIWGSGFTLNRCDVSQCTDLLSIHGSNVVVTGSYLHDQVVFDGQGGMANGQNGSDNVEDTRWPGWEHNDIAQIFAGDAITFEGNNLQAFFITTLGTPNRILNGVTASGTYVSGATWSNGGRKFPNRNYLHVIYVGPAQGLVTNLRIKNNWFGGGENHIQIAAAGLGFDVGNSGLIDGNRFQLNVKGGGFRDDNDNPKTVIDVIASLGTFNILTQGNVWDNDISVPSALRNSSIDPYKTGTSQIQYWTNT